MNEPNVGTVTIEKIGDTEGCYLGKQFSCSEKMVCRDVVRLWVAGGRRQGWLT